MGLGIWIFVGVVIALAILGLVVLARRQSGGDTRTEHDYSNPHIGEAGRPQGFSGGGGA